MNMTDNEMKSGISVCAECGSRFLKSASHMKELCPECASLIYGYENCSHIFENGICRVCLWDGSRSEYTADLAKKRDDAASGGII